MKENAMLAVPDAEHRIAVNNGITAITRHAAAAHAEVHPGDA
jgi:hypothetical protein